MKIGSLFSGYAGLELGLQSLFPGAKPVWFSEVDPAADLVLTTRFPEVPNYGDITELDPKRVEPVDIIAGGSPCQDFSIAGTQLGLEGARSGLWREMVRIVAATKPKLVVWENVMGAFSDVQSGDVGRRRTKVGLVRPSDRSPFGRVMADLASLGYDTQWGSLRASDVGAPHARRRVFVVAYPRGEGPQKWGQSIELESQNAGLGGSEPLFPVFHRFGGYTEAITRWANTIWREPPNPIEDGVHSPAFVEWMMGLPGGWVTGVPGLSRAEQLQLLGNGVVPQQAAEAIRRLLTRG